MAGRATCLEFGQNGRFIFGRFICPGGVSHRPGGTHQPATRAGLVALVFCGAGLLCRRKRATTLASHRPGCLRHRPALCPATAGRPHPNRLHHRRSPVDLEFFHLHLALCHPPHPLRTTFHVSRFTFHCHLSPGFAHRPAAGGGFNGRSTAAYTGTDGTFQPPGWVNPQRGAFLFFAPPVADPRPVARVWTIII